MDVSNLNQNNYTGVVKSSSESSNEANLGSAAVNASSNHSYIDTKQKPDYELSISEQAVLKAVDRANKARTGDLSHVEYSVHKPYGDIIIKVVNTETKEIIHEYPPEKILNLLDKLQEINGTIVDEKR
ncbi:hypothetical protein Back11_52600 [Paenibacillus baekrokdamisoli]|uniref:Uncharacterized protein n=1 Tax=Paenibacillus baekrokdamisoli TaxID=1712516 RepID=A0A3G9J6J5_9BACL|nr:flagellar protein FlaG [Paenibacillus baekrokdamisoli]MBB3069101.1 flagellar protein FlaG [Paenibacillus baekrokdamisoli]BBH23915.1 hypothetical protein Back11_52600 [Paenibacillus baekrokdamisoli]